MKFNNYLKESIIDQGIFKAVFMAGQAANGNKHGRKTCGGYKVHKEAL